jgi:hypothetical protein
MLALPPASLRMPFQAQTKFAAATRAPPHFSTNLPGSKRLRFDEIQFIIGANSIKRGKSEWI